MSPTTRSARAGGAALREGTPISAGHDVTVAPRPDGSWVVQPNEGRSAASHPPRAPAADPSRSRDDENRDPASRVIGSMDVDDVCLLYTSPSPRD